MSQTSRVAVLILFAMTLVIAACSKKSSPAPAPTGPTVNAATATATASLTASATWTYSSTPAFSATSTPTPTAAWTATWTLSPTVTGTWTFTSTPTPSSTPTVSATPTITFTPTATPTVTHTFTPTATSTATPSACWNYAFGWTEHNVESLMSGVVIAAREVVTTPTDFAGIAFFMEDHGFGGGEVRVGLYADNGTGANPGPLLYSSSPVSTVVGWNFVDLTATNLAPATYWLAVQMNTGMTLGYSSVSTLYRNVNATANFASGLPSNGSVWSGNTYDQYMKCAIFATTCGAAVPTYTPIPTNTITLTPTPTATPEHTYTATPTPCSNFAFGWTAYTPGSLMGGTMVLVARESVTTAVTVDSIGFLMEDPGYGAGNVRVGLYADNGSGSLPGALLASSDAFLTVAGWNVKGITPTALTPGTYWLAVQMNGGMTLGYMNVPTKGRNVNALRTFSLGLPEDGSVWSSNTFDSYMKCAIYAGTCGTAAPTLTPFPTTTPTPTP